MVDKKAVEQLEKAYKSLSVSFPSDNNVSQQIAAQEREHKERGQKLIGKIKAETAESKELLDKFEKMIPFDQMHPEEYCHTFPEWSHSPQNPAIHSSQYRAGLTKKDYHEITKNLN